MSKRDLKLLLEDMLESSLKIRRYTENLNYDSFIQDDKTIDAVIRNFEIIGEAANRLNPDYRINNSIIDWKRIRGFRNRIVHNYFGVDYEIVWSIIENDLDELISNLSSLIRDL
jgi:uncharacterized protein with HEPN domain